MDARTPRGASRRLTLAIGSAALAVALSAPGVDAAKPKTKLVSQSGGVQANQHSYAGAISPTGKFVAFATEADNLDAGDSNGYRDIYIRNMKTKSTRIVSLSSNGVRTNGDSFRPVISATGRFIAFDSDADFLIDGKKIAGRQVYLRDRKTGKTTLISVNNSGQVANNQATSPDISANGRYVTFQSAGSNLNGKAKTGHFQIYLRDRWQGKTYLISKNNAGKAGSSSSSRSAISPDGSRIVYESVSNNLSKIHNNGWSQVYLFNRGTGKTSLVSKNKAREAGKYGGSSRPAISTKGRVIVFDSTARNLLGWANDKNKSSGDVFRLAKGKLSVVSRNWQGKQEWGGSWSPDISPNGRYLAFHSRSRNMLKAGSNGETHIYVRDLATGKLRRASVKVKKGNGNSLYPKISDDGKYVIFDSKATNLVPGGDANGTTQDVLRRGPLR